MERADPANDAVEEVPSTDSLRRLLVNLVDDLDPCREARGSTAVVVGMDTLLGAYQIVAPLGVGGMGTVYRARDTRLGREVAIKVLSGPMSSREAAACGGVDSAADTHVSEVIADAKLLGEAQALARLCHPNVVVVYDVGRVHETTFIAMELVEGSNLRQWLRARRRSWREVLRVLMEAGRGLAAAHGVGLVHRDFKPENVLIGVDDRVRVADFGLAYSIADGDTTIEKPRPGVVLGTPGYMAPEQVGGLATDPRTDQFAFCVTALEMLFGEGEHAPDAAHRCVGAPMRLRSILERGLSRDASRRHPSMSALLDALGHEPRRWGRTLPLIAIPVAMVAIVIALVMAVSHNPSGGSPVTTTESPAAFQASAVPEPSTPPSQTSPSQTSPSQPPPSQPTVTTSQYSRPPPSPGARTRRVPPSPTPAPPAPSTVETIVHPSAPPVDPVDDPSLLKRN
jgi:serine/threonine protein kinase